jgi:oxygen-independent coproporphyrinogen-3 oxidase
MKTSESLDLWLGRPVPRYTSYPPATAFREDIDETAYRAQLANIAADKAISLYIHIPFCRHLCLYCGCHAFATQRDDRVETYLSALESEIDLVSSVLGRRQNVSHLHFGGGSPNRLTNPQMRRLFEKLCASFDFSNIGEIAMEIDPRLTDGEQISTLSACGVTRVSLGVQDFDPEVQKVIGRIQPFDQVAKVCEGLRSQGDIKINFDMMYGLPLQSADSLALAARQALSLQPDRVAYFSYAHVPQMKPHQKALESHPLPDKYELLAQEMAGRGVWEQAGYLPIGMDHYAKPEDGLVKAHKRHYLRRNFQGYTDDQADCLIGLGASSIGETRDGVFQNERDLEAYEKKIIEGHMATVRGYRFSEEDKWRGAVIQELMTYMSCDVAAIAKSFGVLPDSYSDAFKILQPLVDGGVIHRQGDKVILTTEHRQAIRVVCAAFDAYLGKIKAPSSKAA